MFDVHAHLQDKAFDKDRYKVISECAKRGIKILNCGLGKDNDIVAKISAPNVFYGRGLYPVDAIEMSEDEINVIINSFSDPNSICIGEVGLDYYWVKDEKKREREREIFREVIWQANKLKKPLNVHSRGAEEDTIRMLEEAKVPVILHSFGKLPWKEIIEDKRFYFSIPPIALRSNRWKRLIEIVPVEKLLLESDSPYQGPDKNRNTPCNIELTLNLINQIKGFDVSKIIEENTRKVLKIE